MSIAVVRFIGFILGIFLITLAASMAIPLFDAGDVRAQR